MPREGPEETMKGVTQAKGLRNLKTATTTRIHTKPPQRGTAHLDMYLLGKEQQRLEQELANLDERRTRLLNHLEEVAKELGKLQQVAQQEKANASSDGVGVEAAAIPARLSPMQVQPRWKTMPLDY